MPLPGAREVVSLAFGQDRRLYGGLTGAKGHLFFRYDPQTRRVADLGGKVVSANLLYDQQGQAVTQKIHKAIYVAPDGRIYGGTGQNIGMGCPHYRVLDDEGGHLFVYDPATGKGADLGVPIAHEWIINLTGDAGGENIYGMTYPLNYVFRYHVRRKTMRVIGQLHGGTYGDSGCSHECICDLDGHLYGSCSAGYLFKYDVKKDRLIETDLKLPGRDWRIDSLARADNGRIYGGTHENGYLFSFDPRRRRLRCLGQPHPGPRLPGLAFGPDGRLYGCAGGGANYNTRTAFVFRYDLHKQRLEELGAVHCGSRKIRGQRMHAMAIDREGTLYLGETGSERNPAVKTGGNYIDTGAHANLFIFNPHGSVRR